MSADLEIAEALSIRQPWAWLILKGYKDIENRNWFTKKRGRIFIHASLQFDYAGHAEVQKRFPHIKMPAPAFFAVGGIVGEVTIKDCVNRSTSPWFFGKYGFVLENAKELPLTPCKGKLGFFDVSAVIQQHAQRLAAFSQSQNT